jgi:integrase
VKSPPNRRSLTPLFVSKVRALPKAANYWDTKERGLCLRVQPSPSSHRAFKYVYSYHGRPRWFHLGQIHLADARRLAAKLRLAVIEGKDPLAERQAERNADTFQQVADRYLEEYAKPRNRSWRKVRYLVERHAFPSWANRPARSISRSDVRGLVARIKSPSLANVVLSSVGAIFAWALRESIIETNPASGIQKHHLRSRERVLSDTELPLLWRVLDGMGSVEARALQAILLTGQRPGEVLRMRAEHVKDDVWCMPGASDPAAGWLGAKNSRNHRVPLPPPVLDAINGSKSGFVFDPKGRLDVAMKKACATAGIADRVTPHDCRRTFGTLVTRLGFGRAAMDRLLNHADHSVGSIYDRYNYASEDRQIMEAVAAHFLRLVAP